MSQIVEALLAAQKFAMSVRPAVGGFPHLAEALRRSGVRRNRWSLPSAQSLYVMDKGSVVQQGTPLVTGTCEVPNFDEPALVRALRSDQAGHTSFPQFLAAAWAAGVVSYDVDFSARRVSYFGARGESYVEDYPAVEIKR